MLKGLGVCEENPRVEMPVFVNHLDVGKIAREIGDRFRTTSPKIPALLIRDHGITVWGKTAEDTYHYVELVEYIFRYMVAARQAGMTVAYIN